MIPRTVFEPEHEQFRDSARKFFEAEAVPFHPQWEKDGQIDRNLWNKAGELGFLVPTAPEAYGGVAVDFRYNAILNEEASRLGLSGVGFFLHSDIAVPYILNHGSEEQKQKYVPGCISGETIMAIAMTEPGTGSDLQAIKTTAVLDGDEYVINGSKTFITCGMQSDLVIVVCKTNPDEGSKGISLLLVEAGTPGFEKGSNLEKIGMKAQDTAELFFNDVRVPKGNLLGAEGMGFIYLMTELPQERLGIAVAATASAEATLENTIEYVKERKAFGQSIASFQNTQFFYKLSTTFTVHIKDGYFCTFIKVGSNCSFTQTGCASGNNCDFSRNVHYYFPIIFNFKLAVYLYVLYSYYLTKSLPMINFIISLVPP